MINIREFKAQIQKATLPEKLLFQLLEESVIGFYGKFGDLFCSVVLEHKPNMKAVNIEGDTLLLAAARRDNIFAVSVLLTYGSCDVEAHDREGHNALVVAKDITIKKYLSKKGGIPLAEKPSAVYLGQTREQLQEIYTNKLVSNQIFLKLIKSPEHIDDLKILLTGVDPPPSAYAKNKQGQDAFFIAANNAAIIELLNRYAQGIVQPSGKYIPIAGFKENFEQQQASNELLFELIESKADPDHLRDLLTKATPKPDVNARNSSGETSLLIATKRGDEISIQPLLQSKADIESRDWEGMLPVQAAIKRGSSLVVHMLLAAKADIGAKCPASLMLPISFLEFTLSKQPVELVEIVTTLLAYNAEVNEKYADGCSPLLRAIRDINEEEIRKPVVQQLIEAKADIRQSDKDGVTPMLYAVRYNRLDTAQALLTQGISPDERHQVIEYDDEGVSFQRSVTAFEEARRLLNLRYDRSNIYREFKKAETKHAYSATPSPASSPAPSPQPSPKSTTGGVFGIFKKTPKSSPNGSPTTSLSSISSASPPAFLSLVDLASPKNTF